MFFVLIFIFLRYTCFFTPKPNSKCLSFEGDLENFKGPDGVLLCYRNNLFKEIDRKNCDLPNDGRFGGQVTAYIFSSLENQIYSPLGIFYF
jgi:hypothetical protein